MYPIRTQAQQIAQQMRDYIVINSSGENKKRKSVGFNLKDGSKQVEKRAYPNNNSQC